ncbi:unnamed protein product, partial [Ectocarpus fasciculatus]
ETLTSRTEIFAACFPCFEDTALKLVLRSLNAKVYRFEPATDDQMLRLQAFRRLLLQLEAVRAISWSWPISVPFIPHGVKGGAATTTKSIKLMPTKWRRTGGRHV